MHSALEVKATRLSVVFVISTDHTQTLLQYLPSKARIGAMETSKTLSKRLLLFTDINGPLP